jgi:hypothetical protein
MSTYSIRKCVVRISAILFTSVIIQGPDLSKIEQVANGNRSKLGITEGMSNIKD